MTVQETIRAIYTISSKDTDKAAELIAREMSLGVKKTSYENQKTASFAAMVTQKKERKNRASIEIHVPSQGISSAYGLVLSIAGEISSLKILNSIELTDFTPPQSLLERLPGPQFGLEDIRKNWGIDNRPLFITVIKPSQGLSPKEFAHITYESLVGGMDVVKSDEHLQENYKDYRKRLEATLESARKAEEETGETKWIMMHPVDRPSGMIKRFKAGARLGAKTCMISPAASGFPALEELARYRQVPIMAHIATSDWLWQPHGLSVRSWAKFMRILGADIILFPALQGTLRTNKSCLKTVFDVCRMEMSPIKQSMIAVGGGMHAGSLEIHEKLFGTEFAFLSGGGVCGHPDGARAGAQSIRQAWEAISAGIPVEKYRKKYKALDRALSAFATYI